MVTRLDRLPPNARISKDQPTQKKGAARAGAQRAASKSAINGGPGLWRCACGEEFVRYGGKKGAEAHVCPQGRYRIEFVL